MTSSAIYRRIRLIITLITQLSGVIVVLGGVISLLMNSLSFQRMGLAFVEIATPADILLSGTQIAADFVIFMVKYAVAPVLIVYIGRNFVRMVYDWIYKWLYVLFFLSLLMLLSLILFFPLIDNEMSTGYQTRPTDIFYIQFILLILSLITGGIIISTNQVRHRRAIIFAGASAVLLSFCTTVYVGPLNRPLYMHSVVEQSQCSTKIVAIWIGQQSAVGKCGFDDNAYVIMERQNLEIFTAEVIENKPGFEHFKDAPSLMYRAPRDWRLLLVTDTQGVVIKDDQEIAKAADRTELYIDVANVKRNDDEIFLWVTKRTLSNEIAINPREADHIFLVAVSCKWDDSRIIREYARDQNGRYLYMYDVYQDFVVDPATACQRDLNSLPASNPAEVMQTK